MNYITHNLHNFLLNGTQKLFKISLSVFKRLNNPRKRIQDLENTGGSYSRECLHLPIVCVCVLLLLSFFWLV